MQQTRRITKADVIVVCICLLVIFCLLLPGVESGSRGSARRVQCAARIGQLVHALMEYENVKKKYPGYLNAYGKSDVGVVKVGSWAVTLLPYLDQESLYNEFAAPSTTEQWNRWGGGSNRMNAALYPKLSIFICADDYREHTSAFCSFAANCGFFPDPLPASYEGLNAHERARRSSAPNNGVFSNQLPAEVNCLYTKNVPMRVLGSRADAPTRRDDIRDGLTQTIAFVENVNAAAWSYAGRESGWDTVEIDGQLYAGDDLNQQWSPRVRGGVVWQYKAQPAVPGVADYVETQLPIASQGQKYQPELAMPHSNHPSGSNVAMLGGSVTYLEKHIDYRVFQALMTPRTRKSDVPDPKYSLKESDYE